MCMFILSKQKTAYDIRISDWSSDLCSSDLSGLLDTGDLLLQFQHHIGCLHFGKQHADDILRGLVAEQLPEPLFVPGDPVALDEINEVTPRIAGQRGFGELRIGREEISGTGDKIGEIRSDKRGGGQEGVGT